MSVTITETQLKHLNKTLEKLTPEEILRWSFITFPDLYQTTAFGLTGLVTIDMLNKLKQEKQIEEDLSLIFIDTLYHFPETLQLVEKIQKQYPDVKIHIYKPEGCDTTEDFTRKYGDELWKSDEELYDYSAKVEPAQRAYKELGVAAVLTGRRRSQGGARGHLPILELEGRLIKINPLASWSFDQVLAYIREHGVPYNALLDQGYRSVGDWHSTQPVAAGEDERAGRWRGTPKTECGIHVTSKFAQYLRNQQQN